MRDTNSHAAAARGSTAFAEKKYDAAVQSFRKANAIAPSPSRAFNLGTAEIAAGRREQGSSTLELAMRDPSLRADALYNRGNSALAANSYDYAIRDYTAVLRLRPSDSPAKRNLEIALRRRAMQQRSSGSGNGGSSMQPPQQRQTQPTPNGEQEQQPKSDPNTDALLRSVQQQEQEELTRMNKPSHQRVHVGW